MKINLLYKILLASSLLWSMNAIGQTLDQIAPTPPQAKQFKVVTPNQYQTKKHINNTNAGIIQNATRTTRHQQQIAQFEKDRQEVLQREEDLKQIRKEFQLKNRSVSYTLPSLAHNPNTKYYREAFEKLKQMNPDDYSIKEATFIIENAFYNNERSYADFENIISSTGNFIKQAMQSQKVDTESDFAKNLFIYQYISDTLTVGKKTHKPYTYDFNDYMGQQNWDNMFVHKLIYNGSGQCNSMPRYYQILAEELKTESYLAFAPNHSFIRFKDQMGEWHNAELTSGAIITDKLMMDSGVIKAETILNGNYMVSQSKRQVLAQLLNDLASGYESKFGGTDEFVNQIIESSLALNPNNITSNIHKNNYLIAQLTFVIQQIQPKSLEDLKKHPKAFAMFQEMQKQHQKLKGLGFEEMPKEKYEKWLNSLKEQKEIQDERELLNSFKVRTKKTLD